MKPNHLPQVIERIIPGVNRRHGEGSDALRQHLLRYRFAAAYLRPGDAVVDAACGCGYGSCILAAAGADVVAIDRDGPAVAHGRKCYAHERILWYEGDLDRLSEPGLDSGVLPAASFHRVVSLETLEHVRQPAQLLAWLHHLLRADGVLICSVPIIPTKHFDPYHLHDFCRESLLRLLGQSGFTPVDELAQENCFLTIVAAAGECPDLECPAVPVAVALDDS